MPVDIEKFERDMRQSIADDVELGNAAVDRGEADAAFIRAQHGFNEARLQFILAAAKLENDGIGGIDIFSAAGAALGLTMSSIGSSIKNRNEQLAFMSFYQRAVMAGATREQPEGEGTGVSVVSSDARSN